MPCYLGLLRGEQQAPGVHGWLHGSIQSVVKDSNSGGNGRSVRGGSFAHHVQELNEHVQGRLLIIEDSRQKIKNNGFKGLHADKLSNCEFSCLRPVPTHPYHNQNAHRHDLPTGDDDHGQVPGHAQPADGGSLNGGNGIGAALPLLLFMLFSFLVVR